MKSPPSIGPDDPVIPAGIALVERGGGYLMHSARGQRVCGLLGISRGKMRARGGPGAGRGSECLEETGLAVHAGRLRHATRYRYPHGLVELSFYDCTPLNTFAEPAESSGFRWVPAGDLTALKFPEANEAVIAELAAAV